MPDGLAGRLTSVPGPTRRRRPKRLGGLPTVTGSQHLSVIPAVSLRVIYTYWPSASGRAVRRLPHIYIAMLPAWKREDEGDKCRRLPV